MIKTLITLILATAAAGASAADFSGLQTFKAADLPAAGGSLPLPVAERAAAPRDKSTVTLFDPGTGKMHTVIPVGGGFIYAATGKFVPAVYNGSGYILSSGHFLPVVAGKAREAASGISKGAALTAAKKAGRMACRLALDGRPYTLSFNLKKLAADPEGNPIRVSPGQNYLEALNENSSVREEKGNIVVSGDSDGFFLVYLTLNTASGFTRGDFYLKDIGEGCGDKRAAVTCSVLD